MCRRICPVIYFPYEVHCLSKDIGARPISLGWHLTCFGGLSYYLVREQRRELDPNTKMGIIPTRGTLLELLNGDEKQPFKG